MSKLMGVQIAEPRIEFPSAPSGAASIMKLANGIAGAARPASLQAEPASFTLGEAQELPQTRRERSSDRLSVRRILTADDMAAVADDWNRLAGDIPFRTWHWLATWWTFYERRNTQLCVLAVESETGELVGLAPWFIESTAFRGRVIQFLGSGEVCTDYVSLLASPGGEDEVARAICDWLCGEGRASWDAIKLSGPETNDPAIAALTRQFASRRHTIRQQPGMNCWSVELAPTWDAFLESVHSSRRAKIRQSLRKYIDNGKVVSHVLHDPSELDQRFETLIDLHQRRQRSLGRPGCFSSQRFTAFHREISRRFLALGKLRLLWIEMDGRTIAASYSIVGGQTVFYYQTGVDPESMKVAPGWLGMIGSLRSAIESGCTRFDFLRGDESYKISWDAQSRPTTETQIVARTTGANLRDAACRARARLRGWVKRGFHFGRKIAKKT